MNTLFYLVPLSRNFWLNNHCVLNIAWVKKQDAGDANMQELAGYIANGAIAFLKAEWKVLTYFGVIAAILLAILRV
jgi:K(+)-stimulated pyrophosphate-energized sodium pump